jgi:hypothetical protein
MKLFRTALLLLFPIFLLGCPDPDNNVPEDPEANYFAFGYRGWREVSAGTWGNLLWIVTAPEDFPLPPSRPILNGPGMMFYAKFVDAEPQDWERAWEVVPYSEIAGSYFSNGSDLYYRPPANDEIPPEGIEITYACEVYVDHRDRWERSPDYNIRVLRRDSMDFYIAADDPYPTYYNKDNSCSEQTVVAGDVICFGVNTEPSSVEDIQFEYSLARPPGYTGSLGEMSMRHDFPVGPHYERYFDYTTPESITSPVDITFSASIYDPWAKEKRVRELILHVVPKE